MVFDEPTAVLNQSETENFFRLFKKLAGAGKTLVIVSHKIDETLSIADRATVLRKGKTAAALTGAELSGEKVLALMFAGAGKGGGKGGRAVRETGGKGAKAFSDHPVWKVKSLCVEQQGKALIRSVSFELGAGKIYCVAGMRESGTQTLERALSGFLPLKSGSVFLDGNDIGSGGPPAFRSAGGAYLGADSWDREASIYENLIIHSHRRFVRPERALAGLGILQKKRLGLWVKDLMAKAEINTPPQALARVLSGGMAQRLLATREFAENSKLIIMAEPGWGLDWERRSALFRLFRQYAGEGKALLLFFSDINDLIEIFDELFVLRNGNIALHLTRDSVVGTDFSVKTLQDRINRAMTGLE
jgi:simple sugar transport system ATP-binding protein